jgi:hypothetical protein
MGSCVSFVKSTYVIAKAFYPTEDEQRDAADSVNKEAHAVLMAILEDTDIMLDEIIRGRPRAKSAPLPPRNGAFFVEIISSHRFLYSDTLFLCKQSICEITPEIRKLTNLKFLHACCNRISLLPPRMGLLRNLKVLVLANNRITELPVDIGECTSLREVNLAHNLLTGLPDSFGKLTKLRTLDLSSNKLDDVPLCVIKLMALRQLDISRNSIGAVPVEVLRMKSLTRLYYTGRCVVDALFFACGSHVASLKELCARKVFHTRGAVSDLPNALAVFMGSAKSCSFCGGPYYDRAYEYTDTQVFVRDALPVRYTLCSPHFTNKQEKLQKMLFR